MYFDYQPTLIRELTHNSAIDYAKVYPEHQQWLAERDVVYEVTNYIWPELLSILAHGQIGMITCVFRIEIPDEADATTFSHFSGMKSND